MTFRTEHEKRKSYITYNRGSSHKVLSISYFIYYNTYNGDPYSTHERGYGGNFRHVIFFKPVNLDKEIGGLIIEDLVRNKHG